MQTDNKTGACKQAKEIFLDAASYIRKYGWQKKGMSGHGKPRCSMGALASAHPVPKWDPELAALMYKVLSKTLRGMNLTEFNMKASSGEEVAQLFEQTAEQLTKENTSIE